MEINSLLGWMNSRRLALTRKYADKWLEFVQWRRLDKQAALLSQQNLRRLRVSFAPTSTTSGRLTGPQPTSAADDSISEDIDEYPCPIWFACSPTTTLRIDKRPKLLRHPYGRHLRPRPLLPSLHFVAADLFVTFGIRALEVLDLAVLDLRRQVRIQTPSSIINK